LGIHLDEWESRIIETEKGVGWLRLVIQRSRELFWEPGADTLANEIEPNSVASVHLSLFLDGSLVVRRRSQQRGRLSEAAPTSGALPPLSPQPHTVSQEKCLLGRNAADRAVLGTVYLRRDTNRHE